MARTTKLLGVFVFVIAWMVAATAALAQVSQPAPAQTVPQQPATTAALTIPAGTNLSIRTNENIVAQQQQVGNKYSAEISQDVMGPNGAVLVPKGSPAELTVANTGKSVLGKNELGLALQSVTINGRPFTVTANPVKETTGGIGANKRTIEYVGGGALLGTVIGAVAGGAKGAAIGAVIGGAGGAGTQVLTRGHTINVPAESVLTFHLDQPLQLQ